MSAIIHQALLIFCFVAGKSGGHLLPCITKAEKILQTVPNSQVYLFSAGSSLDCTIMDKHPIINHYIPSTLESIPYKQPWLFPLFLYHFTSYFVHSVIKLWQLAPQKIISFGGLNSVPVCLAGRLLGIPFDLYELNVQPGKTVQFLSYFTNNIYICFAQTADYFKNKRCILTPYPVRFSENDTQYNRKALIKKLSLLEHKKTILILGGSQGSVFLNQAIKKMIEQDESLAKKIQVIHQIGIYDQDDYVQFYKKHDIPAIVFAYHESLQDYYNCADLIICRAGAGTLFEAHFFEKPCIIIPLETDLNNHQLQNGYAMAAMYPDQFVVIRQDECDTCLFSTTQKKI